MSGSKIASESVLRRKWDLLGLPLANNEKVTALFGHKEIVLATYDLFYIYAGCRKRVKLFVHLFNMFYIISQVTAVQIE